MIFLFNGPPSSGKDSVCNHLMKAKGHNDHGDSIRGSFAKHLKIMTHVIYGAYRINAYGVTVVREHDFYENCKNEPNADFDGLSPRAAYIKVSEEIIKPMFGKKYFGNMFYKNTLSNYKGEHVYVSDSGFVEEAVAVGEKVGFEQLLQVKVIRPGYTFKDDSRSYWSTPEIKSIELHNDSDLNKFLLKAENLVG